MDETTAKQRIAELKQLLERYNEEYYVQDAPTVTDYEYDMLMRELEPQHTGQLAQLCCQAVCCTGRGISAVCSSRFSHPARWRHSIPNI